MIAPGTVVADRYRVEEVLGDGGMGVVYRAEHVHMRKRVALKVLLPQWTSTPEVVARFEREAVAAGRIAHPNVAAATDFGRLDDGSFFLVLEYVEGLTLRTELLAGAFEPARALRIARGIASGVAAAHALGIVHRDLKPENVILVDRDGDPDFVKVLDFGIAKLDGASAPRAARSTPDADARAGTGSGALTSAGAVLGTPDYMAPEQALGGVIDGRADLYSLGVILFELLTGECPFRGGAVTVLRQHVLNEAPPLPPDVATRMPAAVQAMVARLLQKEPAARFESATDLLAEIDRVLAPPAPLASRAATAPVVARPAKAPAWTRGRVVLAALAVLVLAMAIVARTRDATSAPSTAPSMPSDAYVRLPPPHAPTPPPRATGAPSGEDTLPPPPPPPRESGSGVDRAARSADAPSAKKPARRTGPGGIYIPPPSTWFR